MFLVHEFTATSCSRARPAAPRSNHTDYLNTPRLVADAAGTTVWRWDQAEPFGNNPADEDPDTNSVAFDLPLRLPGQRYDAETGLHYNYYRDYEPSIGRYGESDPIGLNGGLNTYAYAGGNPASYADPFGQSFWDWVWRREAGKAGGKGGAKGVGAEHASRCARELCRRNWGAPGSDADAAEICTGLLEDARLSAQPNAYDIWSTCRKSCVELTKNCQCIQSPFGKDCNKTSSCPTTPNGA